VYCRKSGARLREKCKKLGEASDCGEVTDNECKLSPPIYEEGLPMTRIANRADRRFEFQERTQLFIRMHNEALTVAAMSVCNPDGSPVGINR
jgi:hypothetical protein